MNKHELVKKRKQKLRDDCSFLLTSGGPLMEAATVRKRLSGLYDAVQAPSHPAPGDSQAARMRVTGR